MLILRVVLAVLLLCLVALDLLVDGTASHSENHSGGWVEWIAF